MLSNSLQIVTESGLVSSTNKKIFQIVEDLFALV